MGRRRKYTEQQIGEVVVEYLESLGADVYQEVECRGGVADIVAKVGVEIWIIEVKVAMSLALIVQGMDRRRACHRVFIAAPHTKNIRDVGGICEELGIGLMVVHPDPTYSNALRVIVRVPSKRWNRKPVALAAKLAPEHKTHAKAGAVGGGGRWTPFRDTCEQLLATVCVRPGITMKEAISSIRHHYSSAAGARTHMAEWIIKGKVPGIRLTVTDSGTQLWPGHQ